MPASCAKPDKGVYGATLSARGNEEGTFQFLPVIQMSGGSYKNVNTEGAREWLSMVKGMIDDGVMSQDVLSLGQFDSTGTFNSGNAAMAISGPWEIDRMVEDADFDWGVTLLPTFEEGGERSSALGGFNLGIMSTTKHPEEAFKVLEYFVSQDDRLFPEFGYLPARGDVELPAERHRREGRRARRCSRSSCNMPSRAARTRNGRRSPRRSTMPSRPP